MEVHYFAKALGPMMRPAHENLLGHPKAALLKCIDQLAIGDSSPALEELDTWCDTIQGGSMGGRANMVSGFLADDLITATRLNIASFKT